MNNPSSNAKTMLDKLVLAAEERARLGQGKPFSDEELNSLMTDDDLSGLSDDDRAYVIGGLLRRIEVFLLGGLN